MSKLLDVPYLAQNDNEYWNGASGSVQCAPTSYTMLAYFLKPELFDLDKFLEPECYYKSEFESLGYSASNRGEHSAHVYTLAKRFGIYGSFRTDLSKDNIIKSIDAGYPVVAAIDYGSAGHVIAIIGYDDRGFIVNDPNGELQGLQGWYKVNYGRNSVDEYESNLGVKDRFSWNLLSKLYFSDSSLSDGGWGFIVDYVE